MTDGMTDNSTIQLVVQGIIMQMYIQINTLVSHSQHLYPVGQGGLGYGTGRHVGP